MKCEWFKIPAMLFVVAFSVRVAAILVLADLVPESSDKRHRYDPIAMSILRGDGFGFGDGPTAIAGPVYPTFLALVYSILGFDLLRLRLVLSAIDAGQIVIYYLIARRNFDERVARMTGLLLAFCPYFLLMICVGTTETLFLFLNAVFLLAFLRATQRHARRSYFVAGVACGMTTLCRATTLLLPLFMIPVFVVRYRRDRLRGVSFLIWFLSGMLVTVGPWTYRNYVAFGRFVPIQTLGGYHLYLATGERKQEGRHVGSVANDRDYFVRALTVIKERPLQFADRMTGRIWKMWGNTHSGKHERVLQAANCTLLAAAIVGMWFHRRRWQQLSPMLLLVLNYSLVHMVAIVIFRYMLPTVPILVMFASAAVVALLGRKSHSQRPGADASADAHQDACCSLRS
jgi:4-amino-4-deoxy-L-arabinose transferase-like glycosyltransferase